MDRDTAARVDIVDLYLNWERNDFPTIPDVLNKISDDESFYRPKLLPFPAFEHSVDCCKKILSNNTYGKWFTIENSKEFSILASNKNTLGIRVKLDQPIDTPAGVYPHTVIIAANCQQSDFRGSSYFYSLFIGGNLAGSDFTSSEFYGSIFYQVDLSGCSFRRSSMEGVKFVDCNLDGCDFRGANLSMCIIPSSISQKIVSGQELQKVVDIVRNKELNRRVNAFKAALEEANPDYLKDAVLSLEYLGEDLDK